MIKISEPKKVVSVNHAKLEWKVSIDEEESTVWLAVLPVYAEYLCEDRNDGIVLAILNYAMRYNHDICSEAPITEDLFFNLDNWFIDGIAKENTHFHRTKIVSSLISPVKTGTAVVTGISLGVDSMHAFQTFYKYAIKKFALTHLVYNNVGSFGANKLAQDRFNTNMESPLNFAKEVGLDLITVNSNLQDVFKQNHYYSNTYVDMFPVYSLQKLFGIYYYASGGFSYNEFSLKDTFASANGEFWSLPLFSTPSLRIYSAGEAVNRIDKLSSLVDNKYAQKYLNVCITSKRNCGVCEKCVRTMLELDALDSLDKFRQVFDVDNYKKHRNWYLSQMMSRYYNGEHDYKLTYERLKKRMPKYIILKEYFIYTYMRVYRWGSRMKSKILRKEK
jgi:hypothetical protein